MALFSCFVPELVAHLALLLSQSDALEGLSDR
jgi:hypothetical protein